MATLYPSCPHQVIRLVPLLLPHTKLNLIGRPLFYLSQPWISSLPREKKIGYKMYSVPLPSHLCHLPPHFPFAINRTLRPTQCGNSICRFQGASLDPLGAISRFTWLVLSRPGTVCGNRQLPLGAEVRLYPLGLWVLIPQEEDVTWG